MSDDLPPDDPKTHDPSEGEASQLGEQENEDDGLDDDDGDEDDENVQDVALGIGGEFLSLLMSTLMEKVRGSLSNVKVSLESDGLLDQLLSNVVVEVDPALQTQSSPAPESSDPSQPAHSNVIDLATERSRRRGFNRIVDLREMLKGQLTDFVRSHEEIEVSVEDGVRTINLDSAFLSKYGAELAPTLLTGVIQTIRGGEVEEKEPQEQDEPAAPLAVTFDLGSLLFSLFSARKSEGAPIPTVESTPHLRPVPDPED